MHKNQFFQRNKNLNIPESELNRMYRIHQEQMMMEQLMMEAAHFSTSSGGGPGSTSPTDFVMTFGIDVDVDGNQFRFGMDISATESTTMTFDWGDGQTEEFVLSPSDTPIFNHPYALAGSYTVNIIISNPAAILNIYADAND